MLLYIASLLMGLSGAWAMSRYAVALGLIDIPNERSSHIKPTPRGGGIGILLAFMVSSIWMQLPVTLWLPTVLLALVSFFDDRLDLSARTRMAFQFIAAAFVAGFHFPGSTLQLFLTSVLEAHAWALSPAVLWLSVLPLCIFIVGTANFYNFMDGINGIAGITGAVGFALMSVFAYLQSDSSGLALSAACLSAACIGFLPLNMPRARVFMGDVGSILLGFLFAVYVLFLSRDITDFLTLAGFLSTFYADTLTTLCVRMKDRERLSTAHRRHLYQLFANQKQVAHWKVSCAYGLLQATTGAALFAIRPYGLGAVATFEVLLLTGWFVFMKSVRRQTE